MTRKPKVKKNLKPISLALPPELLQDLEHFASEDGLQTRPFIRSILIKYVRALKEDKEVRIADAS